MPQMTRERLTIRKAARQLQHDYYADYDRWLATSKALDELRKVTCQHPAMKRGTVCGVGWSECPDCLWSS